jgi:hypothetical protein
MSLEELTSPGLVRKAMREYDVIGRTAFLANYGICQSRE